MAQIKIPLSQKEITRREKEIAKLNIFSNKLNDIFASVDMKNVKATDDIGLNIHDFPDGVLSMLGVGQYSSFGIPQPKIYDIGPTYRVNFDRASGKLLKLMDKRRDEVGNFIKNRIIYHKNIIKEGHTSIN